MSSTAAPKLQAIDAESVHRICSGQVVVDLSTAIKELVENAIDANAKKVEVTIRDYGLTSIQVSDDGSGIDKENYAFLARKHWTSKISNFEDLEKVRSFGFRGEALSSLCALAKLTVITRTASESTATKLEYSSSGELKKSTPTARGQGTTILLEGLFKPLPVRYKEFQKNKKREYGKAVKILQGYAIIAKGVRIHVVHKSKSNRTKVVKTEGSKEMRSNLLNIFGTKQTQVMRRVEVDFAKEDEGLEDTMEVRLSGWISKCEPKCGRSSSDRQHLFINGRPVDLVKISRAINDVYRSFCSHREFPVFAIELTMETNMYDVNVTPNKRTVFIRDSVRLINLIKKYFTKLFEPAANTYIVKTMDEFLPRASRSSASTCSRTDRCSSHNKSRSFLDVPEGSKPNTGRRAAASEVSCQEIGKKATENSEEGDDEKAEKADAKIETSNDEEMLEGKEPQDEVNSDGPEKEDAVDTKEENAFRVVPKKTPERDEGGGNVGEKEDGETGVNGPKAEPPKRRRISQRGLNAFFSKKEVAKENVKESNEVPLPDSNNRKRRYARRWPKASDQSSKIGQKSLSIDFDAFKATNDRDPVAEACAMEAKADDMVKTKKRKKISNGASSSSPANSRKYSVDEGNEESYEEKLVEARDSEAIARKSIEESEDVLEEEVAEPMNIEEEGINIETIDTEIVHEEDSIGSREEMASKVEKEVDQKARKLEKSRKSKLPLKKCITFDMDLLKNLVKGKLKRHGMGEKQETRNPKDTSMLPTLEDPMGQNTSTLPTPEGPMGQNPSKLTTQERLDEKEGENEGESALGGKGQGAGTMEEGAMRRVIQKSDFAKMEIIGQFNLGFIITKLKNDLFIIDQHATDEKYMFEKLQRVTKIHSQVLFKPMPVRVSPAHFLTIIDHLPIFKANGFEFCGPAIDELKEGVEVQMEDEDPTSDRKCRLFLKKIPYSKNTTFGIDDIIQLCTLLADAGSGYDESGSSSAKEKGIKHIMGLRIPKLRAMFASRACRSSVMIGTGLMKAKMRKLVRNMGTMDQPWYCPHGRPTMRHLFDLTPLEKMHSEESKLPPE